MGELITIDASKLNLPSKLTQGYDASKDDSLTGGVESAMGVVAIRGKVFRIKYNGEEKPLLNNEGDPVASLRVVMLDASEHMMKAYYEKAYAEGDNTAPDCWSADGKAPAAEVEHKQSETCAACFQNTFGSRINDNGKDAKACQESRRIAVVPFGDVANERFGGPMLLRVPGQAARKDLFEYGQLLKANNIPPYAVVTKISFDNEASFPKLLFSLDVESSQRLTDHDAELIQDFRKGAQVKRIIAVTVDDMKPAADTGETPPKKKAAPRKTAIEKAAAKAEKPKPKPVPVADPDSAEVTELKEVPKGGDLDDMIGDLLG